RVQGDRVVAAVVHVIDGVGRDVEGAAASAQNVLRGVCLHERADRVGCALEPYRGRVHRGARAAVVGPHVRYGVDIQGVLGDLDCHVIRLVVVVGAAAEAPVGCPSRSVAEREAEIQAAAGGGASAVDARATPGGAVAIGVVGQWAVAADGADRVGLVDRAGAGRRADHVLP